MEKMMGYQFRENGARNIYQTNIRRELVLNALEISQNNYTLSIFPSSDRRNFEDSGKVLAVSVSDFTRALRFSSTSPCLYDVYHYCLCTNRQLFLYYLNRCRSMCVAMVISSHAFVSHLGMFSKIKLHLFNGY